MKFFIISLTIVACFCLAWWVFRPIKFQTYRINSGISTSWISIEYNRADCAPLADGLIFRDIQISADGHSCTSSPMETGWTHDSFYLETNPETALDKESSILSRASLQIHEGDCQITAETFLLRLQESDKPSNSWSSFLEQCHPECQRGVQSEVKPQGP